MAKTYRIEEFATTGWETFDQCERMTKEDAQVKLQEIMNMGVNPKRLRVVRDDGA
tara:strand:- start:290 stop:454 length:165 start_codon:yes stop_codon:yes gene_type:complete